MIEFMKKHYIIQLMLEHNNVREVHRLTKVSRDTIAKYWKEYNDYQEQLAQATSRDEVRAITESMVSKPKYDTSNRTRRKYNDEIEAKLIEILESEARKNKILGSSHKQALTKRQIYELIKEDGHDIGETIISAEINRLREKHKECFIKQLYEYGDRLEYDFGEFKASINGVKRTYYLAVLVAPASGLRWAFIYKNMKKDVFLDSHVRFFHMFGGVWKELVYDNMKNVVTAFLGPNEKKLNVDLINLSHYYGFKINVTNCYSGNEKGSVESGVKFIRNKCFAKTFEFSSEQTMHQYLESNLLELNRNAEYLVETDHLLPLKPKYELAKIVESKVNKLSLISVETNQYSVPDYLVEKTVTTKIYHDEIHIYSNQTFVCKHKKKDGKNMLSMEIKHYINTLLTKPGAVKNSHVLKSHPELKTIFDKYYSMDNQSIKIFLTHIKENSDSPMKALIEDLVFIAENDKNLIKNKEKSKIKKQNFVDNIARKQTNMYNNMISGRKED